MMTLFDSTRKLLVKIKNGENVLSLKVVEVFLLQWNLVDNQYQTKVLGPIIFYAQ